MKRIAKIFLLIGILSFAILFISLPLLHNHQIDYKDHPNCPAFILSITFATFAFVFLIKILIDTPRPKYKIYLGNIIYVSRLVIRFQSNRAPPF